MRQSQCGGTLVPVEGKLKGCVMTHNQNCSNAGTQQATHPPFTDFSVLVSLQRTDVADAPNNRADVKVRRLSIRRPLHIYPINSHL